MLLWDMGLRVECWSWPGLGWFGSAVRAGGVEGWLGPKCLVIGVGRVAPLALGDAPARGMGAGGWGGRARHACYSVRLQDVPATCARAALVVVHY